MKTSIQYFAYGVLLVLTLTGCSAPDSDCNCKTAEYTSLDGTKAYDYDVAIDCETGKPYDNINMGGYFTRCLD